MPARPEYGRRSRKEGLVEIFLQTKTEQARSADHQMRVTREIHEQLKTVPDCQKPRIRSTPVHTGAVKPRVNSFAWQQSAAEDLSDAQHEEAKSDAANPRAVIAPRRRI